jgi:hypothetical protein
MLSTYYAPRGVVMHEIRRYCSDNFLKKHFEEMYFCYRRDYEPLFGERAFGDIKDIVEDFKAFYGED